MFGENASFGSPYGMAFSPAAPVEAASNASASGAMTFDDLKRIRDLLPPGPTDEQKRFAEMAGYPCWDGIKVSPSAYEQLKNEIPTTLSNTAFGNFGVPITIDDAIKPGSWSSAKNDWEQFQKLMDRRLGAQPLVEFPHACDVPIGTLGSIRVSYDISPTYPAIYAAMISSLCDSGCGYIFHDRGMVDDAAKKRATRRLVRKARMRRLNRCGGPNGRGY
jgi:hypothetical protein